MSQPHWLAPTHGMSASPAYTAQASGCFAVELSEVGPGLHALARSKPLGSGSQVFHKGADSVGPVFLCPSQV